MKPENIIFHFGGVLVDWSPGYVYEIISKKIVKRNIFLKTFVPKNGI
jgi:hypothetical protein